MSNFIETPRFPDEIAAWLQGGRGFKTTVVETYGGDEFRNAAWANMRAEYTIADAFRAISDNSPYVLSTLYRFQRTVRGQLYGFRVKDYTDYRHNDAGGTGGVFVMLTSTTFQMYKRYALSPLTFDQIIQKPVSAYTGYAGIVVTGGVTPVVDYTTGIVTVASGTPTSWTGQFDVPCRFAEDIPGTVRDASGGMWDWQSLKLIEIRDIA